MILRYQGKGMTRRAIIADDLRISLQHGGWPFAKENCADIEKKWINEKERFPSLFNGEVLMTQLIQYDEGRISIDLISTDYASLRYWQRKSGIDQSRLPFGLPVLRTSDDYFVLGRMSAETANSGMAYFPSGTISSEDLSDNDAGCLICSVMRELKEETGLDKHDVSLGRKWLVIETTKSLACFIDAKLHISRDELRQRFFAFKQRQGADAELDELVFIKRKEELATLDTPIAQKRFFDIVFRGGVPDSFFRSC